MPITVVFDPPLPSDSPITFNTKAFTLLGDLNDWSTQANALPGEVATNLSALLASPPAIGGTTPAAGSFTTLSASGNVTLGDSSTDTVTIPGPVTSTKGILFDGSVSLAPGAGQGAIWHSINYLQLSGGTDGVAINNHANTVTNLLITDAGAVTIPGALSAGATAVTTLSASDTVSITKAAGVAKAVLTSATGTNEAYYQLVNGGGGYYFGIENNAGSWFGATPYAGVVQAPAGRVVQTVISATPITTVSSSGLAVTGGTFGYGTGAGGTVTQATSKSTAVTLNKPCGQITMHNEALAAGATVYFQVTNSMITALDTVALNLAAFTGNGYNYQVWPFAFEAGSFYVAVRNITAGSLPDAVAINFAIIKGATS